MRLRRLRGISQAQLASRIGTKQPAVARIESGQGNPRLDTLAALARALGATVRVDLEPIEILGREAWHPRWWERDLSSTLFGSGQPAKTLIVLNTQINNTTVNVLSNTSPPGLWRDHPRREVSVSPEEIAATLRRTDIELPAPAGR